MSGEADNLTKHLEGFGLIDSEFHVYTFLLKHPSSSILTISRNLKIARTKIYRVIEKLLEKQFIVEKVEGYGKRFIAESPEKLFQILKQKEDELEILKKTTPIIVNELNNLRSSSNENSRILHYQGTEGLKQVTWNSIKAKGELRIFELALNMDEFMPPEFNERARAAFVKNKINIKQLTNYTTLDEHTEVTELLKYWEPRYMDPADFKIKFEILIYNDVYAMYNFRNKEMFCVEIYNAELAEMQKQIFDNFWNKAQPMTKVGKNGKAVLEGK